MQLLFGLQRPVLWRNALPVLMLLCAALASAWALDPADDPIDHGIRAALLARPDGEIARIPTTYNDIVISKKRSHLTMAFRADGDDHIESIADLRDPDSLPVLYTRAMTTALAYPPSLQRILMIGVGGGSIPAYLVRAMPEISVDGVDIDPGVIAAAGTYFGLRETPRLRLIAADGRAFLRDTQTRYDLILLDAFAGVSVPFPLVTREFFALLKTRLTPGGVAALNIHEDTAIYLSILKTLQAEFGEVRLHPSGEGEMIAIVGTDPLPAAAMVAERAAALQKAHRFRYPLPSLIARRARLPALNTGSVFTDAALQRPQGTVGEDQRRAQ